ncbi:MAG: electron transfer flavoprotein subunit beta, partial [Chloroflexi bacterium]|nr:electron transfer flavoprotein subunit beta [Chloroflexota bacterium]
PSLVVCTQALGEPRYPSLKGIMAARSKEVTTRSIADLGLADDAVGGAAVTTRVTGTEKPPARGATKVIRGAPDEAAREVVAFLAERRII